MKNSTISVLAILMAVIAGTAACQRDVSTNVEVKNTSSNALANASSAKNENVAAATPADSASTGSLATPTEAYKTASDYRRKKDIAGLKRVMSKDVLDFLTDMGKADKKTLDDMLREMTDEPQASLAESRNEQINGDKAFLEYRDDDGQWKRMDFVKENGEWKLSLPDRDSLESEDAPKKKGPHNK